MRPGLEGTVGDRDSNMHCCLDIGVDHINYLFLWWWVGEWHYAQYKSSRENKKPAQKKKITTSDDSGRRQSAVISKKEETEESGSMGSRSLQQKGHRAIEGLSSNMKVDPHLSLDGERGRIWHLPKSVLYMGKMLGQLLRHTAVKCLNSRLPPK